MNFGEELVSPEEKTARVGGVFSSVARRYDLMNDLMSGGAHRLWKNRFVAKVKPRAGEAILDMAGGTGDIAFRMARHGAQVTVADINADMLAVGMERAKQRGITGLVWQAENAEKLTFADKSFDAYTIAFGIRNVTDIPAALREAHRVLKRGGRFYCLEFSTSEWPGFGELYDRYSDKLIPRIGKLSPTMKRATATSSNRSAASRRWTRSRKMIADAGFANVSVEPILGGPCRNPWRLEDLTTAVDPVWRLLKWGRTLARHGALTGIERDPLTPPFVRRLARVARFGASMPDDPDYAAALQAIGPAAIKLGQALATRPDLVGDARRDQPPPASGFALRPSPSPRSRRRSRLRSAPRSKRCSASSTRCR